MKIVIKQSKLLNILSYLYVDGLFPFVVITTKDKTLISTQSDKDHFVYRFFQALTDNFIEISTIQESVKFDVEKVKGFVSLKKADDQIVLLYPSPTAPNKMQISCNGAKTNISVIIPDEKEIQLGIPFVIKEKIPYIRKGEVALDTHVVISLSSFKDIDAYASKHGTEFYRYILNKKDRKLQVLVGDIHEIEDSTKLEPTSQVMSVNEDLDVTFTKGIKEVTKVFSRDVDICLRSNQPGWFNEISQSHRFGVMISPLIKKD